MPKTNLLLLTLNSSIGGTEKMVLSLSQNLDKNLFNVSICSLVGDGTLIREAQEAGIRSYNLRMKGPLDFTIAFKLGRIIRREKIDILHSFLFHTNILGRILGRLLRVPVVISSQRNTGDWRRYYHRLIDRWTAGLADLIISNSEAGKQRLVSIEKIKEDKIRVIYNGVETSTSKNEPSSQVAVPPLAGSTPARLASREKASEIRESLGIGKDTKVVGTVANLKEAKGLEYLIKSIPAIAKVHTELMIVIVGYGPLENNLKRLAGDIGVKDKIVFAGYQGDARGYTAMFDVFVLPSLWEGMSVALMDAMALGKPVIATNVGGIPEIIDNGVNGIIIEPKNGSRISEAVLGLLKDPSMCETLGREARSTIERKFTLSKMVSEMEKIYKELLEVK